MPRPQFSLKTLLWSMAIVALLLAQFSTLDRIWLAFADSKAPVVQLVCLPVIWGAGYLLFRRC